MPSKGYCSARLPPVLLCGTCFRPLCRLQLRCCQVYHAASGSRRGRLCRRRHAAAVRLPRRICRCASRCDIRLCQLLLRQRVARQALSLAICLFQPDLVPGTQSTDVYQSGSSQTYFDGMEHMQPVLALRQLMMHMLHRVFTSRNCRSQRPIGCLYLLSCRLPRLSARTATARLQCGRRAAALEQVLVLGLHAAPLPAAEHEVGVCAVCGIGCDFTLHQHSGA